MPSSYLGTAGAPNRPVDGAPVSLGLPKRLPLPAANKLPVGLVSLAVNNDLGASVCFSSFLSVGSFGFSGGFPNNPPSTGF